MRKIEVLQRHDRIPGSGVLLVNLGTPEAPTPSAVRRYLAQFLSDSRVIDLPRWLWKPILHGIILRVRPRPVAQKYRKIWAAGGSPLMVYSERLAQGLSTALAEEVPGPLKVALAMSYGAPEIDREIARLLEAGVRRLLIVPLFPQYSATTTGAVFDAVSRALARCRWLPETRWINDYFDHPDYITALATKVRAHWQEHGQPQRLITSFHGIPQRYFDAGDPYFCHCHATARLLAEELQLGENEWELAFQSRFGREPWLQPYLDKRLEQLPAAGVDDVQVICPGFASDCLETLEEIEDENRERFLAAGGRRYQYIAALNDDPQHVRLLAALVRQHGQGWVEFALDYDPARVEKHAQASARRAKAAGAAQ